MPRLLHTGDLHLCSPMAAFPAGRAADRRERQWAALEKMLSDARSAGACLLLFAGDVFDTTTPPVDAVRRFYGLLFDCGLPALIAPGNHDYYREGGFWDAVPLPDNVTLFRQERPETVRFPALSLSVTGFAFRGENAPSPDLGGAADRDPELTNILLGHADLLSPLSPYAALTPGQIEASRFALALLGHIHNPPAPRRFGETVTAYCGFFAGRGFDELGPGHANLIDVAGGDVRITALETTTDCFAEETLDLTGTADGETLRRRVSDYATAAKWPSGTALRLCLTGAVSPDCTVDGASIDRIFASLDLFEYRDETLPILDAGYLEKDPGPRGAFYRAMKSRLESGDPDERAVAAEALRLGFAALAGREVAL